ncbi:MAG: Ni/Fe hydrogenase subunit alpha [Bacteroidetes bacterium]|jgi:coenzyme F420-reducing hydrogenase alpha subunit|nr:Ni/Fe hydrogenase subunit alpha [Bacteroidota bacterium]
MRSKKVAPRGRRAGGRVTHPTAPRLRRNQPQKKIVTPLPTVERVATGQIRNISVGALARVEGEGGIAIRLKGDVVQDVKVRIYEPPRFFEAFLRKRSYHEVPDITARICGICPVAYQTSSCQAIEHIFDVTVDGALRDLRRLLYCGEWIESHVLHIAMLHLPDFLGYEDAIQLSRAQPELVKAALRLKKIGNDVMVVVGGREIHPVNVRVGGFYRLPRLEQLRALVEPLRWALGTARELVRITAGLTFPDFTQDYEFVALRHPDEYPVHEGRIVSSKGVDIAVKDYESVFAEEHVEHSNALHSVRKGGGSYLVGPLARYNLNFDRLTPQAREAAEAAGLRPPVTNQFQSIIVRAIETVFAVEESLRIIEHYEPPAAASVPFQVREGIGMGCTEAPRGILYHRYKVDGHGLIQQAKIVPPTSQNLRTMESDLRAFATKHRHLPTDRLTWQCEQAVRNYDPCISCATHFLKLEVESP